VRAISLTEPIRLDGRLDEAVYHDVPSVSDFVQQVPRERPPAAEKTEVWVMFDSSTLYISARCWDRLHRRTRHARPRISRLEKSRVRREGESPVSILSA
jgi:hypothetical protein